MKRILSLFLAILLLAFCFASCVRNDDDENITQHVHIFENADCTSPKVCECGATEGKPSNSHNFKDGVCTKCTKKLIVELARMVTVPGSNQPVDGFYISRDEDDKVKHVTASVDMNDRALNDSGVYIRVTIKLDQEAINTGVYQWAVVRSTYIEEDKSYDRDTLYGMLNASGFLDVNLLEITKNDGFSEDEVSAYIAYAPTAVDRIVRDLLIPALDNNPSRVTVSDLGFVNYGAVTTTK